MAKKQSRYFRPDIEKALPDLVGEHVNLILQDGQVFYLKLIRLEQSQLIGLDGVDRVHRFPIHLLEEVIAEKHA